MFLNFFALDESADLDGAGARRDLDVLVGSRSAKSLGVGGRRVP
jgi:hypothetical protein